MTVSMGRPGRATDPWPSLEAIAFGTAAFLLFLVVRLPTLDQQSLWYDEVITANVVASDWGAAIADRLSNGHFPTYFLLLKALGLAGASDEMLRLPSALFGGLAAAIFTALALRLGGTIAAVASTLLFALMPNLFFYGQEARPYMMMVLALSIATLAQIELIENTPRIRSRAILAACGSLVAALSIPAGIVSVAVQQIAAYAAGLRRLPLPIRRGFFLQVVITWVLVGLAALALIPNVERVAHEPQGLMKWQAAMAAPARIAEAWGETFGFAVREDVDRFLPRGWEIVPSLVFCGLIVAGALLRRRDIAIRYLIGCVIGTPLVFFVIGIFSATAGRYMIGMLPPAILLASVGASELLSQARLRWPLGLAMAVAVILLGLQTLDASQSPSRYDWRPLVGFLIARDVQDAEILTNNIQAELDMRHYLPADTTLSWRAAQPPLQPIETVWQWARERDTAWLLIFFGGDTLPADVVDGRTVCRWNFGYATLFAVTRDRSKLPAPLRGCAGT